MQAARYERSEARQGYHRSGHYDQNLTTTSGDATLQCSAVGKVFLITAVRFWNENEDAVTSISYFIFRKNRGILPMR